VQEPVGEDVPSGVGPAPVEGDRVVEGGFSLGETLADLIEVLVEQPRGDLLVAGVEHRLGFFG
jgi:hypothetical protein